MTDISLLGPIHEKRVTFLLDTSGSMYFCLRTVQENLIEALYAMAEKPDTEFNVIEFNRTVNSWADQCVPCNAHTIEAAARWIKSREATTGNNLVEGLAIAFADSKCDAVYVISNSLPVDRKNDVIEDALHFAKNRPVNCVYLASTLSDPAAEELLYDLAWETRSSFRIMEVSESGRFQRANLIFDGEQRHVRSTSGRLYPRDKFCSVIENPFYSPPTGLLPVDMGLPWQNRHNPLWWSQEACNVERQARDLPLSRYHFARASLRQDEIRDAVLGAPAMPGAGMLLIDKKVLARRIEDGFYYLGRVKSEVAKDKFLVQFDELSRGKYRNTVFQEVWIYDIISFVDAFRHPLIPGDKALVPVENGKFAPAVVLQGHEQRSDPSSGDDKNLIVNHLDGRTETLEFGMAIWIPHKLYERVSFELRLPVAARKALETHVGYPEASKLHEEVINGYVESVEEDEVVELEGDVEYEEVLLDENPYKRQASMQDYYENLYPQWPWWWKMWYQKFPLRKPRRLAPRVVRRSKIIRSPERTYVRHSNRQQDTLEPDLNFVDYEDAAADYFQRLRENEQYEKYEQKRHMNRRQNLSPTRLSYSEEATTQTRPRDLDIAARQYRQFDGEERPPWRYWKDEEPLTQPRQFNRLSASPSRLRESSADRLVRIERSRERKRWFESSPTANQTYEDVIEYRDPEMYEIRQQRKINSATIPREPKPKRLFVDYVARDVAQAEWNERFEPKPLRQKSPPRSAANNVRSYVNDSVHVNERRHYVDRYIGHESANNEYQYQQRRRSASPPPAGMPTLTKYHVRDEVRSRRAHHMQRQAAEEERELRHAARKEQAMDARRSYNASVAAWFAEKEDKNFEREQEKTATLQRKRAQVEARQRRVDDASDPRQVAEAQKRADNEAKAAAEAAKQDANDSAQATAPVNTNPAN